MKWFMIAAGVFTASMFYALVAPQEVLQSTFGETLSGPLAEILVRNWGALIGFVGLGLVYGAVNIAARRFALLLAVVSKVTFIGLVLTYGRGFLSHGAGFAIAADAVCVIVFLVFLVRGRGEKRRVNLRRQVSEQGNEDGANGNDANGGDALGLRSVAGLPRLRAVLAFPAKLTFSFGR